MLSATNGFQSAGFQSGGGGFQSDKPSSIAGSVDEASDPVTSSIFTTDFKAQEDLKQMLDSSKDGQKLDAMKRVISMVAKGKDASHLFPQVVKNVASKNLEIKKLVYVYLTRYAEEQQDLALLSISTFQRALKDPNQLIRASALRVLSGIRVPIITPILMLAIKESVMDMSPYVRKTAANAIPKLYSLDPDQKPELVEVIEKLLGDKTTLVAGSVIQAFEEVCPERIDLIHKNFRKLCGLLVDVDEWGQVVIINMLTRYARTQFVNPNDTDGSPTTEEKDKDFYSDSESNSESDEDEEEKKKPVGPTYVMDQDHRLLLRNCKPLLNSRNSAVVLAVAQLYYHCAPKNEVAVASKALIRLLKNFKEIQAVVLNNIATMSVTRKDVFEPYIRSFYVRSTDATPLKLMKLEILTNLASETNISTILREFQTYVSSTDNEFAAATIQAIGRCATKIAEVSDACLNGLVHLMSSKQEVVVAESVVVIKKLLQMKSSEHSEIITQMARMVDNITIPMARSSILWLIGEYSERVPTIAPDVLRKMAKTFADQEDIVKLQILNLAAKLCLTNPKQTRLLCQYVLNMAKYDLSYDIRDRARFIRALIFPTNKDNVFAKHAKKILLAPKPAPTIKSYFEERERFQLGTLSHFLNVKVHGYQELADWPEVPPDPTVRDVEVPEPLGMAMDGRKKKITKEKPTKAFYSDSEEETSGADEESGTGSSGETESGDDGSESESESADNDEAVKPDPVTADNMVADTAPASSSEVESSEESGSDATNEETSSSEDEPVPTAISKASKQSKPKMSHKQKEDNLLLLDFDPNENAAAAPQKPAGANFMDDLLAPVEASAASNALPPAANYIIEVPRIESKSYELLNKYASGGLSATYTFPRTMSIFDPKMVSVQLTFTNTSEKPMSAIRMGHKKLQGSMRFEDFPPIDALAPGSSANVSLAIDFCDTTNPAGFELLENGRAFNVTIKAPVGELLQPYTITEGEFVKQQNRLRGMNEHSAKMSLATPMGRGDLPKSVLQVANVVQTVSADDASLRFASRTISSQTIVLVTVHTEHDSSNVCLTVNTESLVIGSMLLKDLKQIFEQL